MRGNTIRFVSSERVLGRECLVLRPFSHHAEQWHDPEDPIKVTVRDPTPIRDRVLAYE